MKSETKLSSRCINYLNTRFIFCRFAFLGLPILPICLGYSMTTSSNQCLILPPNYILVEKGPLMHDLILNAICEVMKLVSLPLSAELVVCPSTPPCLASMHRHLSHCSASNTVAYPVWGKLCIANTGVLAWDHGHFQTWVRVSNKTDLKQYIQGTYSC